MASLITLDEYKSYFGLTKTDSDARLEVLIGMVSSLIKSYCGTTFIDYFGTPKVEIANTLQYQDAILLKEWPVVGVVSVETRGIKEAYLVLDPDEYHVSQADVLHRLGDYWPAGPGAVRVSYTAGYEETPSDIKLAACELVHHYLNGNYKERKAINSTSQESTPVEDKWPVHIVRVLELYRNV